MSSVTAVTNELFSSHDSATSQLACASAVDDVGDHGVVSMEALEGECRRQVDCTVEDSTI